MLDPDLALIFTFVIVALLILVGGVVLRPFVKRLGDVMERYLSQKSLEERESAQLDAVRERLESLDQRMALMEERLEFTESLLTEQRRPRSLDGDAAAGEPEKEAGRSEGGTG